MSIEGDYIFGAIAIGIGATLVMDLWNLFLKRTFSIPSLNYCLLGRWLSHMPGGTLRHASISAAPQKPFECTIGRIAHYTIGVVLALVFVVLTSGDWLARPTLLPALLYGIGTVVFPFFIMQPSFGLGIAASRTPKPTQARLKSLVTHTVFGVGLYVCALGVSYVLRVYVTHLLSSAEFMLARISFTSVGLVGLALLQPQPLESQKPPWLGEGYLRPAIYGKVYDSASKLAAPKVAISVAGRVGIAFSDSAGWYLQFDVPVGRREVQFRCSSERRWLGRTFATRIVWVSPYTDSVVDFYVPLSKCVEPPVTTIAGEWSGHYEYGFETSLFTPCVELPDLRGTAYQGIKRWISVESLPTDSNSISGKWPDTGNEPSRTLFVRWRGRLTGPGSYGHLGLGVYQLDVHEVLEVRRPNKSDCR